MSPFRTRLRELHVRYVDRFPARHQWIAMSQKPRCGEIHPHVASFTAQSFPSGVPVVCLAAKPDRFTARANRGSLRFTRPLSVTCPSSSRPMTGDMQNSTVRGDRSSTSWPADSSAAAIYTSASSASVAPIVDTKCSSPSPASSAASVPTATRNGL